MEHKKYSKLIGFFAERGINRKEVAEVLGCTPNTVSKKLNRNSADITMSDFQKLSSYYNIDGNLFKLF